MVIEDSIHHCEHNHNVGLNKKIQKTSFKFPSGTKLISASSTIINSDVVKKIVLRPPAMRMKKLFGIRNVAPVKPAIREIQPATNPAAGCRARDRKRYSPPDSGMALTSRP